MLNSRYISYLILISFMILLQVSYAQSVLCDHNLVNTEGICKASLSPLEQYKKIVNFNKRQNQLLLKNNDVLTHKLDSIETWKRNDKLVNVKTGVHLVHFLENNLLELRITYDIDEDNIYTTWGYNIQEYNKENKLKKQSFTYGDGTNNNWDDSNANISRNFSYDSNGLLVNEEIRNPRNFPLIAIKNKYIYNYNSINKLTSISEFFWYSNLDSLVHIRETNYGYNGANQLIEVVRKEVDDDLIWINRDSIFIQYLPKGQIEKEESYFWSQLDQECKRLGETIYTYSEEMNLEKKVLFEVYDYENEYWKKMTSTYYDFYDYNSAEEIREYESRFDGYVWSEEEIQKRVEYMHNKNIESSMVLYPRDIERNVKTEREHFETFVLSQTDNFNILPLAGYFDFNYKGIYHYSELETTSVEDTSVPTIPITISPNPVRDILRFDLDAYTGSLDIKITDIQGRQLIKTNIHNGEVIDVNHFLPGVYFYTVWLGKKRLGGRFVVGN